MNQSEQIESYNYGTFAGNEDFLAFRAIAQVGTRAPDFTVVNVNTGEALPISNLWRGRDVLIEFGSLT